MSHITDAEFAEIAQTIQRITGCGGLTSNEITADICIQLGITECEGRPIHGTPPEPPDATLTRAGLR